jgi:predicted negative regulator of RcsB-dependent stress response
MADPLALSAPELFKLGLQGVIIFALAWVCWRLWGRVEQLQDKRVEDAQKLTDVIAANTASRDQHTEAIERLTDAIRNPPPRGRGRS